MAIPFKGVGVIRINTEHEIESKGNKKDGNWPDGAK